MFLSIFVLILFYSLSMAISGVTAFGVMFEEDMILEWWKKWIDKLKPIPKVMQKTSLSSSCAAYSPTSQTEENSKENLWRYKLLGGCMVCSSMQLAYWLYPILISGDIFQIAATTVFLFLFLGIVLFVGKSGLAQGLATWVFLSHLLTTLFYFDNYLLAVSMILASFVTGFFAACLEFIYNYYLSRR